jgi:hypothetical protein
MQWTRVIGLVVALAPGAASASELRVSFDFPIQVGFQTGYPAPPPPAAFRPAPQPNRVWMPERWEIVRGHRVYHPGYWEMAPAPVYAAPVYQPPVYQGVEVSQAPPPPQVDVQTPMPFPGAVWIPGAWQWNGRGYYWAGGQWSSPRPGWSWESHRWVRHGRHWSFRPGHWRR